MHSPDRSIITFLSIALFATLAIYSVHVGDFLILDSVSVIENNPGLEFDSGKFDRWRVAALSSETGPLGRSLGNLAFAVNVQLAGGVSPVSIKIWNVFLHLAVGLVAWRVLMLALVHSPLPGVDARRAGWVATLAVVLWLLHPLHVSTVFYAVQRLSQLSTLFILLGLWVYLHFRVRWLDSAPGAGDISRALLWLVVFTGLAALSKENGLLLPVFAAALELTLFRGRTASGHSLLLYRTSQFALLLPLLAIICLLLLTPGWLTDWYSHRSFTPAERVLTELRVLWSYLSWMLLWDFRGLGLFHDDVQVSSSLLEPLSTLLAVAAWLAAGIMAWWCRHRQPIVGFALLWYFAGHLMESTIVPLELVFEHRNYLASVGPLVLVAWLMTSAPENRYGYARLAGGVALVLLGFLLFVRTSFWQDELGLAESHFRHHPDSFRSRLHLADVYYQEAQARADTEELRTYFLAARELHLRNVEQRPEYVPSLVLLVFLESQTDRTGQVQQRYRELSQAVGRPDLDATDFGALKGLVNCVDRGDCLPPEQGLRGFLENFLQRQDSVLARELLIIHCFSLNDFDCVDANAEAALDMEPGFYFAYRALYTASVAREDVAGMHDSIRRMMAADPRRRQIYAIRNSVAPP